MGLKSRSVGGGGEKMGVGRDGHALLPYAVKDIQTARVLDPTLSLYTAPLAYQLDQEVVRKIYESSSLTGSMREIEREGAVMNTILGVNCPCLKNGMLFLKAAEKTVWRETKSFYVVCFEIKSDFFFLL
jgi:hypothetical protein